MEKEEEDEKNKEDEKEEEKKEEEKEKKMRLLWLYLYRCLQGKFTVYKIWPNFASMVKFRPSLAFCVFLYSFFHLGFYMEGYVIQSRCILGTFSYRHNLLSYGFDCISNSFENKKCGAMYGPQQAEEDSSN